MVRLLLARVMMLIPVLLSLSVHEWAHAWAAWRLGDDTAAQQGRLTLNPVAHIDPIGTLLLPLLGVPFGWAKPVPVNPSRFRRDVTMARGMMLTALAGPASNAALAALCGGLFVALGHAASAQLRSLLLRGAAINASLAAFNLLPIPPLDGSRVVDAFLPYAWRPAWQRFAALSWVALLALVLALNGGGLFAWLAHALPRR